MSNWKKQNKTKTDNRHHQTKKNNCKLNLANKINDTNWELKYAQ